MEQLHIIRKFSLELQLPDRQEAYTLQRKCSEQIKTELVPALDKLLNEYFDQSKFTKVQRLEIDLGTIAASDFEKLFIDKCLQQLSGKLKGLSGQKELRENSVIQESDESRFLLDQFFYFLQTGRFLLPASFPAMDKWQEELAAAIKPERTYFGERFTKLIIYDTAAIERLILQFDDHFLQELINSCEPSVKNDWARLVTHLRTVTQKNPSSPVRKQVLLVLFHSLATKTAAQLASQLQILNGWFSMQFNGEVYRQSGTPAMEELVYILREFGASALPLEAQVVPGRQESGDASLPPEISSTQENKSGEYKTGERGKEEIKEKKYGETDTNDQPANKTAEQDKMINEKDDAVFINNAGLVLFHPFLVNLFEATGLISNGNFPDDAAKGRAVHLLQFMASGEEALPEYILPLNKLLCGLGDEEHIDRFVELTEEEKKEAIGLMEAVVSHWTILKNTSAEGLRQAFLQRRGKLSYNQTDEYWKLQVEASSIDILLDKLPWGISYIQLPWMKHRLITEWH